MIFYAAAVISVILSLIFSYDRYDNAYFMMNEAQVLFTAAAAYYICPMSKWRMKVVSSVYFFFAASLFLHNIFVICGFIKEGIPALISFLVAMSASLAFGVPALVRWESLPSHQMREGYIYEIIGKPRTNLQMLGFFLSFGRGGDFALTNGVFTWKFCKKTGKFEENYFQESHVIGKKIVEIGPYSAEIRKKVGSKWSIFNNCHTIRRWAS